MLEAKGMTFPFSLGVVGPPKAVLARDAGLDVFRLMKLSLRQLSIPLDLAADFSCSTAKANETPLALRREKRDQRPSARMRESLEYLKNASAHMASVAENDAWIPKTYQEAVSRPDLWWPPMAEELEMLKERGVYKVVPRLKGKNVVQSKWVFAPKFDADGELVRRKARVVAKGLTQVLGEDYGETYAPVACVEPVRLVCAIAASRGDEPLAG